MAPTTLVTFLVRTPPSTTSVQLYGSWDNFSAPYPMQRDPRVGREHWSGCHSFSNIICDGDVTGSITPRQGGLKMGGTYWYYYTLDHEIEFHSSGEPSTTTCPMLPGQLVNVLNVPFALSSSSGRSRNVSVSSTHSEHRTMDPMDKFLKPRPVPTKPSLPRLKTSPTFSPTSWSSTSSPISAVSVSSRRGRSTSTRATSPPGSAKMLALVRPKPSAEIPSRSTSQGSNRSVGIIGGIRALTSPLLISPGAISDRERTPTDGHKSPAVRSHESSARVVTPRRAAIEAISPVAGGEDSPSAGPLRELTFRKDLSTGTESLVAVPISSFSQHRRQRSVSREPSSLRNAQQPDTSPDLAAFSQIAVHYQSLDTVREVASTNNTPVWPLTAVKVGVDDDSQSALDLEKRLPTLPNTPSSAYPSSFADGDLQHLGPVDMMNLQSHFSCTTIDSEAYTNSYIYNDNSRFSDWTDAPATSAVHSAYTSGVTDFESINSPLEPEMESSVNKVGGVDAQTDALQIPYHAPKFDGLPSASSFSTVSSIASSAAPSSQADPESAKSGHFSWSKFQHYSLPSEEVGSGITIKPVSTVEHAEPLVASEHRQVTAPGHDELDGAHSSSMQELLDELSYLGGMIQQH